MKEERESDRGMDRLNKERSRERGIWEEKHNGGIRNIGDRGNGVRNGWRDWREGDGEERKSEKKKER